MIKKLLKFIYVEFFVCLKVDFLAKAFFLRFPLLKERIRRFIYKTEVREPEKIPLSQVAEKIFLEIYK
ncbi:MULTISPECIES: hypothetical protein [Marinomonas]|uniref:Uncharacterized protein n=1 Tax=Marinomonas rhodophyticola TaxID=2992803 RepID=A0ABT3KKH7_9GAMM|nr:hypothetical protein [Marinomonas sp. KJ51-3]MCW4631025.1 hypothetical protein [Marinomonas sp. KJ51-3]